MSTVVDGVCTFGDLPPDQCGHCRGITAVDLDSAHVAPMDTANTRAWDQAVARHRPRQYGKVKLSKRITAPNLERVTVAAFLDNTPELDPAPVRLAREVVRRDPLNKLGRVLLRTAAVYASLAEALHGTRGAGEGDRVTGGGGDDKPMPLQHQVAEHRHLLVRGLRYWSATIRNTKPQGAPGIGGLASMVAYIVGNLDALTEAQRGELEANMLDWQRRAHILTDLPTLRGTIPLGAKTCPGGVEGLWTCDGQLVVLLPADKGNTVALRCAACGGRWDVADLPDAVDVRLSLSDAAAVTHSSVRTLQYRVQHGSLPARAGMVRLGDVLRSEVAL